MRKGHIKKGSIAVSLFILIAILIISLFIFKDVFMINPDDNPIKLSKNKPKTYSLSLAMVGDVLIHGSVYQDAIIEPNKYDFKYIFTKVKPLLNNFDLKVYNQESIIGGKTLGLSSYPRFNSPEEIGDAMTDLGFNMVSLANNHTLDKGIKGITNSINYWKAKDIMTAGSYLSEEDRVKDNIKTAN
jgi:poly-gamma-glutamate synthesis protein (capsule biosynthesis protein)